MHHKLGATEYITMRKVCTCALQKGRLRLSCKVTWPASASKLEEREART